MSQELMVLLVTAVSIGFFHTILGPDHYVPFIVMSRSGKWSMTKTAVITTLCGLGHVLSSILLGFIGILLGITVSRLEHVESMRGNLAAWALIAFGLAYFVWGVRQAWKNRPHVHLHRHDSDIAHGHEHTHNHDHMHIHADDKKRDMTPWILFTIFFFGPCEPLIPLIMYPASQHSMVGTAGVATAFGGVTIGTMLILVLVPSFGMKLLPMRALERYTHAIAGASILLCGLAIQFLGL